MKKALLLLGPTGVGKTAASLMLAEHLRTEIISADSMQIYRLMDIGTAKPSPAERARIPHHMLDIIDPWERYSTGAYIAQVAPILDRLHADGTTPLVVGGTGLYLKAMTRGIFQGPSADSTLRASLRSEEEHRPGTLYSRLMMRDPDAASRIDPHDLRRVLRALEVCILGDTTISQKQQRNTSPLPYLFLKIGLTRSRPELYGMIDRRVDTMIEQGLVTEVETVMSAVNASASVDPSELTALQAIGYKELIPVIRGETSLDEAVALIKQRSRNYAKRQYTWFRKEPGIHWIDITGLYDEDMIGSRVIDLAERLLA